MRYVSKPEAFENTEFVRRGEHQKKQKSPQAIGKKVILTGFVKRWLFPAQHEEQVDFYAGRMLAYRILSIMGYNAERLYGIEPDSCGTPFDSTDAVVDYLTAE